MENNFIPSSILENERTAGVLAGQIDTAINLNTHFFKRRSIALAYQTNTQNVINSLPQQIRTSLSMEAENIKNSPDPLPASEPLEIILSYGVEGCDEYIRDVVFAITSMSMESATELVQSLTVDEIGEIPVAVRSHIEGAHALVHKYRDQRDGKVKYNMSLFILPSVEADSEQVEVQS